MKLSTIDFSVSKAVVIPVACCLAFSQLSCTKEGPAGPAGSQGPPGSNGTPDDLTNPNIFPAAIFTSPGSNTTGPFNLYTPVDATTKPHFVVRFNKYMLKASVSSRSVRCEGFDRPVVVRLFEPYRWIGPLRSSGVNSEFYDNILEFTIEDSSNSRRMPYRVGRTYTAVIDTLLEDINGNHPVGQYRFSFTPEPYFRVVDMYPKNGATDVGQSLDASITFNASVDGSILQSIRFSPVIIGQWSIPTYDSARVSFTSGAPLAFNTQCDLTVLSTARDPYGNQIRTGYSSTFSITPFKVESWWPVGVNNSLTVSPLTTVYVYFTGVLDENTIAQGWSISPPVVGILDYYTRSSIQFWPTIGYVPSTTYTVTISTAIRALDGTALQAPFVFSFVTDSFRCTYFYPPYGSTNVSRTNSISFLFNSGIDTSSVHSSFTISPQVGLQYAVYSDRGTAMSLTPMNPLAANRTYTVTISTGLRSKTGASLSAPHTVVFTTGQ